MVTIEGDVLARMIRAVLPAASRDETRLHMAGVMLRASAGELVACATDGHRLHLATLRKPDLGDLPECLVDVSAAAALARILLKAERSVELRRDADLLVSEWPGGRNVAACLTENFLPYAKVIPAQVEKGVHAVSVAPEYLADALLAVKHVARPKKLKKGEKHPCYDANRILLGLSDTDALRVDATYEARLFDFCAVVMPRRM